MDTYVKGFSFMPTENITLNDNLKYIQSGELEQTWKTARRERIKQRDQRIWEEFVQEQDVVSKICTDDPYQFLEQLPESCIKELLENELQKKKEEEIEEEIQIQEEYQDYPEDYSNEYIAATTADSDEKSNVFHIFDDKEDNVSGPEDEVNESVESTPCTVRDIIEEKELVPPSRPTSGDKTSSKSSENISSVIEKSIHCARIKDLRNKINEELIDIISFLEQSVINIDPEDVAKLSKRSAEFWARFNRVHVYELQRQVQHVKRHSGEGGAGAARHTRARAQLARLVSLQHNLLHAVQAMSKFVRRRCWWGEGELHGLVAVLRDSAPHHYSTSAGTKLPCDDQDISVTCDKLCAAVKEYNARATEYLNNINALKSSSYTGKTTKMNNKKKLIGPRSKNKMPALDSRLSMYSLEPDRPRPPRRNPLSGTSKPRISTTDRDEKPKETPAKTGKPPRTRGGRAPTELHTLVEAVAPPTSSHVSCEGTPQVTPRIEDIVPPLIITPRTPKPNNNTLKQVNETVKLSQSRRYVEDIKECSRNQIELKDNESKLKEIKTREGNKVPDGSPEDMSKLLRELCSGDGLSGRNNHAEGPKNVQLVCVKSSSPRQPSTTQLLRILEETIQKKSPRPTPKTSTPVNDTEKYRMTLNVSEYVTEKLFQYRTKFIQHMLTSSLYANSSIGKPWEMIGSVSEHIINELLQNCAKEMELHKFTEDLYKSEMC